MILCQNCLRKKVNRPRGLCFCCYYSPDVRERYPTTSKYGRRGVCDYYGKERVPPVATSAMPGTQEKVCILVHRAEMGVSLWHPADAISDPEEQRYCKQAVAALISRSYDTET